MKRLAELCDPINDQCDPSASGASVYVGLEHIDSGAFQLTRYGSPADVRSAKSRFRGGDVLYGKLRPYLDKAILANQDGICSTDILVFRPKPDVCGAYLLSLIHSVEFLDHSISTTHGVNHPRTSWSSLSTFEWDVPEKRDQEKIAAVLWKVQRAMEVEKKLVATARELKQSAMRQLFTHGLCHEPQKESEIGPLPQSWDVVRLGDQASVVSKGASPKWQGFQYTTSGILFVRSQNVGDGRMEWTDKSFLPPAWNEKEKRSVLKSGDVLVNLVGASIGRAAVGGDEIEGANCNQAVSFVRLKPQTIVGEFLAGFLLTAEGQRQIHTTKKDIARANLSLEDVRNLVVPKPQEDEQRKIATILQTIDRKISLHDRKRAALQELFKTLLHQLISSQIRVDNLDIDTSEVAAC